MKQLTEKRKADRFKMIAAIADLAKTLNVSSEIRISEGESTAAPRQTLIHLEDLNGLGIHVDFDGQSIQPDVYVLSWHMTHASEKKLSDAFAGYQAVNRFHRRKATQVACGFDNLISDLKSGYEKSASGIAFEA